MHTLETFHKLGEESVQDVIENLGDAPRPLHEVGVRVSVILRVLLCILSGIAEIYIAYFCIHAYVHSASFIAWIILVMTSPIAVFFVPWLLISTFQRHLQHYQYYANIYIHGVPTVGTINMLTRITGRDSDCHHMEYSRSSSRARVRVDYTFIVEDKVKTGTMMIRESDMVDIAMNREICVLYLPEDASKSMLFPIPGHAFFGD